MITRCKIRAKAELFMAVDRLSDHGFRLGRAVNRVLPRGRVVPVRWLEENAVGFVRSLDPALPAHSYGPRVGGRQSVADVVIPEVALYHFEGGVVSVVSSSVLFEDFLVLEGASGIDPRRGDQSAGLIRRHGAKVALVDPRPAERIERGLFLGGNGAFNYYHWMIEILPKLRYLQAVTAVDSRFAGYPLLVSEDVEAIPTFAEALRAASDLPRVILKKDRVYQVGSLLYLNSPNNGPFNIRPGHTFRVSDHVVRPTSVAWLRETFAGNASPGASRLFFARRNERRKYNQAEIWNILQQRGFQLLYMEDLTLAQQVAAMAAADVIAGPTGAAWTNLIFCRPGTRALCWMSEQSADFAAFSVLAAVAGADLRYVTFRTDTHDATQLYHLPYVVDANAIRAELDQLLA